MLFLRCYSSRGGGNRRDEVVPDAAKRFLDKTKAELYSESTSRNLWAEWSTEKVQGHLYAAGHLGERGACLAPSLLSLVVLRMAASLRDNAAIAGDALRAVAVSLDLAPDDGQIDSMAADLKLVLYAP